MDPTEQFVEALQAGDYGAALRAYRQTDHARTSVGRPTEALLQALTGDHAAAARTIAGCEQAELIELIVKGERERAARWTDPRAAAALAVAEPLPYLGVYAGMAVALLEGDQRLIEQRIAPDVRKVPPVAGRLTFTDGGVREFSSIVDSDDGIGAMLETYGPGGLLYIPFAAIRSLRFLPARNFIDRLVPRAEVELTSGEETTVLVPLLYALSTTSKDASIRAGRMTTWRYVGPARRGLGQRDFVIDGGRMIGMQRVAAIELTGAGAAPRADGTPAGSTTTTPAPPSLRSGPSPRTLALVALVLLAVAAVIILR